MDAAYLNRIYRPLTTSARIVDTDGSLTLTIDDPAWRGRGWTPLIPDHGKLMHMFLIREGELDAFAHIHPIKVDDWRFAVTVPPLPAGSYRIYADVTHESGFVQTLTDLVELPEHDGTEPAPEGLEPDPDDSWHVADVQDETRHTFDDGAMMTWDLDLDLDGPIRMDEETTLTFSLKTAEGEPAALEPYMGMMSHAAVRRDDGSVFIHLHPTGTISMAAQMLFETRGRSEKETAGGEMDHGEMDHSRHAMGGETVSTVTLPYVFPRAGDYRIWVQVKSAGRVYTGVFATEVMEKAQD